MFIFREENTFKSKIRIFDPTEGGRKVAKEIEVEYRVMSPEYVDDVIASSTRARAAGESTTDGDAGLLMDVVAGWSGIKVDSRDGEDFVFSDENLKKLIAIPYVRAALVTGYFEGINGKARKGN